MKRSFPLQVLILVTLAAVTSLITLFWARHVYHTVYDRILDGFDRKLLTLSTGAAAFVEGDAHAAYQRKREITALLPYSEKHFAGYDPTRGEFVALATEDGGALPLAAAPEVRPRALVRLATPPATLALSENGTELLHLELGKAGGKITQRIALARALDGIAAAGPTLVGWHATVTFDLDPASGAMRPRELTLPAPLRSLAIDSAQGRWFGLATDGATLWSIDPRSGAREQRPLHLLIEPAVDAPPGTKPEQQPAPPFHALLFHDGKLHAAGVLLATIDPATGRVDKGRSHPGFFSVADPFYQRYRPAFMELQRHAGLSYLYTQVYLGDKKIYYVIDGTVGENYSPPGSGDALPDASVAGGEIVQFIGRPWISPIQQWNQWGLLKSSFSPLFDSKGQIVAMAGADVEISIIKRKTSWALFAVVLVGIGTFLLGGWMSFRVARTLTQPLREMKNAALRIAAGFYDTRSDTRGTREIEALGSALNVLSADLRQIQAEARTHRDTIVSKRGSVLLGQALQARASASASRAGSDPLLVAEAAASPVVWAGNVALLWFAPAPSDDIAHAVLHARAAALGATLLHRDPASAPRELVAALPGLIGAALWHADSRHLDLIVHCPVDLEIRSPSRATRRLTVRGATRLSLAADERIAGARRESHPELAATS